MLLLQIMVVFCLQGMCNALKCWHCIAENCDTDPDDNNNAEQRTCKEGQLCQKVNFAMHSRFYNKEFYSTVRGCSSDCQPKNDFWNCTRQLYSSRGCVEKVCCDDNDLCNSGLNRCFNASLLFTTIAVCIMIAIKFI